MIEKVEFHNFKALRDVSLDLERLTVLVGPNASGKTSALEGLYYLSQCSSTAKDLVSAFGGEQNLRSLVSRSSRPIPLQTVNQHGSSKLAARFRSSNPVMALKCSGRAGGIVVAVKGGPVFGAVPSCLPSAGDDREKKRNEQSTQAAGGPRGPCVPCRASFLRFDIARLIAPSYSEQEVPEVEPDGGGLASVLAYIASNRPEDIERLLSSLRTVVPNVRNMRFPRAKVVREETEVVKIDDKEFTRRGEREYWGNSIELDMKGASRIPARMAGEGTLLVLGLLTALMGPDRPCLALLDDLDRALHPKAQERVVAVLRKLLNENEDLQIIATSHSPYLLDHFKPEEVRLTTLNDDGSVAVGRLTDHPQFEKWKDEMSPGEFWSLVGEKWVAEAAAGGQG